MIKKTVGTVVSKLTRQPIIPAKRTGLNGQNRPVANVAAVRNPLARAR